MVTVDPGGARRRREQAEREDARVRFWRERAGASALAGYGLPTDAALRANANIGQRAQEYKKAGPGNVGQPAPGPVAGPGLAARANLTFPLATLLGLADRPGEGYGLGPRVRDLDPNPARRPPVHRQPRTRPADRM